MRFFALPGALVAASAASLLSSALLARDAAA